MVKLATWRCISDEAPLTTGPPLYIRHPFNILFVRLPFVWQRCYFYLPPPPVSPALFALQDLTHYHPQVNTKPLSSTEMTGVRSSLIYALAGIPAIISQPAS